MKTTDLILTPTGGMNREQWLSFRQPQSHIKKFIVEWMNKQLGTTDISPEAFFTIGGSCYNALNKFFDSEEWKQFTFPCLGGSEISAIMGLNPYKSIIELYYEKIGQKEIYDFDNIAMFWGRELEEQIAQKWQYWEGTPESLLENFKADRIIRKCRRLNSYVQNKKFPWLFVSLDRLMNKAKGKDEGVLECKTISGFSADMWESGIPPMYIAQLQTQLAVAGCDEGEIAILKDGRYFEIYPFDKHEEIIARLIEESKKFFEMVKTGAQQWLLYSYCPEEEQRQKHIYLIDFNSPEPDGSLSYEKYLSETYKKDEGQEITGTEEHLELAKKYIYLGARQKDLDVMKTECSNRLKGYIKDASKLKLSEGFVSWKADTKGTRRFLVKVTIDDQYKPDAFRVHEQFVVSATAVETNGVTAVTE